MVWAINLPAAADGSKQGLDDYLAACGIEAFNDLDVIELPPTDIAPFTTGISEFLAGPQEPLEWGIEGIQPLGANGFRIADPKAGKSWMVLSEAYCMSTGHDFCNHFRVPSRRKVIIIEEEDTRRRTRRRLERIIAAHGGVRPSDEFFRISVKKGLRLDNPQWQEVLEYEIDKFRPEFCYLDVWNRLHSKDINSAEDMSGIILFLDQLSREYSCAFIIVHHTRKSDGGGDKHNEIMGSRVLGGFSEATVFLKPTKTKGVVRVTVILKDEPEDGNFESEFEIQLIDTPDSTGTYFNYLGTPPERQASAELRERIKEYVLNSDHGLKIKEIAEAVGCGKTTAQEHLDVLFDLKVINRVKVGGAWIYSPHTPHAFNEGVDSDL